MKYFLIEYIRRAPQFCGLATELLKMHNLSPIMTQHQTEPNGGTFQTKGSALFKSIVKGKEELRNSYRLEETEL